MTGSADIWLFARSQWRRNWRTLAVLSLAAALVSTVILTAATGARRTPGAFERLRVATDASDIAVSLSSLPTAATLQSLAQIDGVRSATAQPILWIRPSGSGLYPGYHLYSVTVAWQGADATNRPIVVAGRAPDDRVDTEIAMNQSLANTLGAKVGDTIALESMAQSQLDASVDGALPDPLTGPRVDATLVGIVKSPVDYGRFRSVMYVNTALADKGAASLGGTELRLADPALLADAAFTASLDAAVASLDDGTGPLGPAEQTTHASVFGASAQSDGALDTIARTLWIFVAISAIAGAVAILQLAVRSGRSTMTERISLMALGWTHRRRMIAVLLTIGPWLAVGVLVALPASVMLSPLALVGLAAQVDPTPHAQVFDGVVLGLGGGAVLAAVATLASTAASVAARSPAPLAAGRRGWVGLGHPLVPRLALRHALGGPAGSGKRSSRTAAGLAAVTVVGVIAALSVSASIHRLQTDQTLLGSDDTRSVSGEDPDTVGTNIAILQADPRVAVIEHDAFFFGPTPVDHPDQPLAIAAVDVVQGTLVVRLPKGRLPAQSDEITLGPALLERFGLDVGDDIVLNTGDVQASYRIVGSALGPEDDSFHFDELAAMTFAGSDRLIGSTADNPELSHNLNFGYVPGTDETAADAHLAALGMEIFRAETGVLPPSVVNLGEVAGIPVWVAAYLGILGFTAIGHGLIVGISTRRREFATLGALGLRRRSAVAIVATQGMAMAAIAAAAGFPVGMLASRQLWQRIGENAHVVVETAWPWDRLIGAGLGASLAIGLAGTGAAARALYRGTDLALRTE